MLNRKYLALILRSNLAFAFAGGMLVLWSYLKEPSEPGSAVFFGFSYLRLILILVVLSVLAGILILLFGSFRNSEQARLSEKLLVRLIDQNGIFWILLLWLTISYVFLFLSDQRLGPLGSYRVRLFPIFTWLAVLSVQLSFVLLYLRGIDSAVVHEHQSIFFGSFILLILFGLFLLVIYSTRIGLTPDNVYWQGSGVPILLHQVFVATFAAILLTWLVQRTKLERSNRLDLVIFLGLWGLACVAWLSQPTKLTYFSLEPREPNFHSYPFSDALIYDSTAHEFLIGKPIPGDLWVKPVYSLFLALLHLFAGENYTLLASLQVVILAIIPAFIYLITMYLDKRLAGLAAAFFVITRERNAMALSDIVQVSHSKLLLSDVFAMGEMILLVWLVLWWLQRPVERRAAPIAVGGMLGLLILTRGHPVLMIPFLFLIGFLVLKPNIQLWYESSSRMILGLLLVLIPWFWHTYQLTGRFTFQDPASPYAVNDTLVKLYTKSSNSGMDDASQGSASYDAFQSQAFRSLLEHPREITYFTAAHYFHNAIFSYVYLPGSFQIEDLSRYVKRLPFWDRGWDGSMLTETWILVLINLAILSTGILTAWKKANRLLLVPLILGAAYNLSIAVARRSGWRFILPADWVTLVFYAIGLTQLIMIIQAVVKQGVEQSHYASVRRRSQLNSQKQSLLLFGLPFFLIAVVLVAGHRLFPSRYPAKSSQELFQDYQRTLQAASGTEPPSLRDFLQQDGATAMYGKALYPVYLESNEGMVNFNWPSFAPQPYDRLAFYLIGPQSTSVNLPIESAPQRFPDGASVIVIGCKSETGDVYALSVLIQGDSVLYYNSDELSVPACPASGSD